MKTLVISCEHESDAKDYKFDFKENILYILQSVEHTDLSKYYGDARSFGYNEDDGSIIEAHYEQAVGILADDAIAYMLEREEVVKLEKASYWRIGEYLDFAETVEIDGLEFVANEINNNACIVTKNGEFFYKKNAINGVDCYYKEIVKKLKLFKNDDDYKNVEDAINCIISQDLAFKEYFKRAKKLRASFLENVNLLKNA